MTDDVTGAPQPTTTEAPATAPMRTVTIKRRWTDAVLYTTEVKASDPMPLRTALERAVADGASLDGARLDGARLDGARLDGASLDGASLVRARLDGASLDGASLDGASLDGARLDGASLDGASLDGARLDGARLDGASLDGASLDGASLDGASLDGARLDGASLDGASLDGASLDPIKEDVHEVLSHAAAEAPALLAALREGRVDGSCYEGDCCCLVGTLANARGVTYDDLPGIKPDGSRPAEMWFLAIRSGDTPERSQITAITARWVEEWIAAHGQSEAAR